MLSSAAVAMQSIFQIPWTCDSARDKQPKLDQSHLYQPSRVKPALDMSFIASAKRKRLDGTSASAVAFSAPQQKRAKVVSITGAVQPASECAPGFDGCEGMTSVATLGPGQVQVRPVVCSIPGNGNVASAEATPPAVGSTLTGAHTAQTSSATTKNTAAVTTGFVVTSTPAHLDASHPPCKPMDTAPVDQALDTSINANVDRVRSVVAAHIDLEILMKHNELRLIEQELAKCQIALEQIRRCDLIPFPGSQSIAMDVTGGVGPALQPALGAAFPRYPTPFGVNDGPYTRHYAQWLISDSAFDSQVPSSAGHMLTGLSMGSRSNRGSATDFHLPPTPIGRGSRNSAGNKTHLIASESPQPNRDPLLMKREMDGQWVRLVCTKCKPERANFQNIQGFLNHCRISHQDNYKSHEQAAIACGRPVEVDESAMPPPPAPSSLAKPKSAQPVTPLDTIPILKNTPGSTPVTDKPAERGFNSSSLLTATQSMQGGQQSLHKLVLPRTFDAGLTLQVSTPVQDLPESPFTASPQTPHLNELLKRRQFVGDFQTVVFDTKQKVDTSMYDCSDSDVDISNATKRSKQKKARASTEGSKHASVVAGRKSSDSAAISKHAFGAQRSTPSLLSARSAGHLGQSDTAHVQELQTPLLHQHALSKGSPSSSRASLDDDMELSPGTGMDSNPGLVSDHEGESDDADEDAVVDPSSKQPFVTVSSMASQRPVGSIRAQTFGQGHGDMMEIDNFIEIHQDISDTERDAGEVRVRESSAVEAACSSRGVHTE